MIDVALNFLATELNAFLTRRGLSGEGLGQVVVDQIVDDAGKWTVAADNIGMTLVNIEEDRIMRNQLPEYAYLSGSQVLLQPELKLNLTVLLHVRPSTGAGKYAQSLRFLSNVVTFFQSHLAFTPEEYPGLDANIDKLLVELLPLSSEQLNQMWGYLGSKYLPSVAYRVRMLVVQDVEPTQITTPIVHVDMELGGR